MIFNLEIYVTIRILSYNAWEHVRYSVLIRHQSGLMAQSRWLSCYCLIYRVWKQTKRWPSKSRTTIQQLCEDTGCNPEDLPEAMNDREKWRERVRDIRASGTTWWWWYIYIQDKALTASAWIWQSHRMTTIWQSLVVSWDTTGALWASGNDASTPKPCLNPESLYDEGFVGSNAVVQTSVIVWYLYIYVYI